MRTDLFDYPLPEERIAQHPPEERDGARLLVVDADGISQDRIRTWPERVPEGALVVLNDTKVFKARVFAERLGTGGRVELLFLHPDGEVPLEQATRFWALGRANKPLRPGTKLDLRGRVVEILEVHAARGLLVESVGEPLIQWLDLHGQVPLPPYVRRAPDAADEGRYQTVFAERAGSAAAPTAGLHVTPQMLTALHEHGIQVARTTLHVGAGTFRPVQVDDLDDHPMHEEWFEVSAELAAAITRTRERKRPVIAVGTTVVRALESAADPEHPRLVRPMRKRTELLIQPGYRFSVVDGLLTNFHAPRSTLLALVSAFAGVERIQSAYRVAFDAGFRFLSYGDAMWLPPPPLDPEP
jgi:S-adenosylmethionine:tRNA ribosyltransferase-isomerase